MYSTEAFLWIYLRVFLSNGNVPMDNNYAEPAIRPFSIGRKNFVMIESSNGAKASAILYSLVETAKANMINTFQYFNLLLTEIPHHMDDKDLRFIDDLLPWSPRVQKECPSRYKKSWFFNVHIYSVKSAQSPHFSGDFWYPVLMFEDLRPISKKFCNILIFKDLPNRRGRVNKFTFAQLCSKSAIIIVLST